MPFSYSTSLQYCRIDLRRDFSQERNKCRGYLQQPRYLYHQDARKRCGQCTEQSWTNHQGRISGKEGRLQLLKHVTQLFFYFALSVKPRFFHTMYTKATYTLLRVRISFISFYTFIFLKHCCHPFWDTFTRVDSHSIRIER